MDSENARPKTVDEKTLLLETADWDRWVVVLTRLADQWRSLKKSKLYQTADHHDKVSKAYLSHVLRGEKCHLLLLIMKGNIEG